MTLKSRCFTLFISIVMLFAMVVPTCATETPSDPDTPESDDPYQIDPDTGIEDDLTGESEYEALEDIPNIRVDIQCTEQIILNPYGLDIAVDYTKSDDLVIGATEMIINSSEVALRVDMSVIGSFAPYSDAFFVESVEDIIDGDKSLFLYLEIQNSNGNPEDADWIGAYVDYDNQILVGSEENFRTNMLVLDAGHEQETYAVFRFFGELSQNTRTAWTQEDDLSVTVVFTFVPLDENGMEIVLVEEDPVE